MATAMETATNTCCLGQIGETAGDIWRLLDGNGPLSTAKLVKELDVPRDVVMLALGWLAREDKVNLEDEGRSRIVSLRT